MRVRRLGMCRGTGRGYVGVRLTRVPEGARLSVLVRTDAGREVPALWCPDQEQSGKPGQLRGVLVVPLLQTDLLTIEFIASSASYRRVATVSMRLGMSALKWASRFNYRARARLTEWLRAVDTGSQAAVELLLCVPDGEETVWRLMIEARGLEEDDGLGFLFFDARGRPFAGEPILLEKQVIALEGQTQVRVTVSFRLPSTCKCFCIAASSVLSLETLCLFGVGPGEYNQAVALTHKIIKDAANANDYRKWREEHALTKDQLESQKTSTFPYEPLISIITPSYQPNLGFLKEMLSSVCAQTYDKWELILVDSEPKQSGVGKLVSSMKDGRIQRITCEQNLGIVGNTNLGIEHAKGDYIAFLDYDDLLAPSALHEYVSVLDRHPKAGLLYCDEDMFEQDGKRRVPVFKPRFNRDLLYCNNSVTHFMMIQRQALMKVGLSDDGVSGAQDYDLALKLSETDLEIVRVPSLLYHWRMHSGSTSGDNATSKPYAHTAGKVALERHFARRSIAVAVEDGPIPFTYRVRYALPEPHPFVDIIIPSKDHVDVLDACVSSILEKSTYDNYRITIVENNSTDKATFRFYKDLKRRSSRVDVVRWQGEFNYPKIINFGMQNTEADYALLLNNDTEVISPDFIEEMLGYLQRPEVGVVGAKLYFPDKLVQHAGMLIGPFDTVVHINQNLPSSHGGYLSRAERPGNFSSVTGACQMVKRSAFDAVGGYSEEFEVGFNDADFCCKLTQAGYLVVFSPYAELFHREFVSRGREEGDPQKMRRWELERKLMMERWPAYFVEGDPYSNPNLARDNRYFALPE
ncbi:MAG: glycosyltransferase family 2 protein [Coriobacteriia bacterium]|nr:glycosyltransferase family 2 protein [Coriobacteriia bacterium]